jgi:hypothetical protein
MSQKSDTDRTANTVSAHVAHTSTEGARAAADELHAGAARIEATLERHAGASLGQKAGRVAEEFHAATLNADAAQKGLSVRARTTASLGQPCAAADIVLSDGSRAAQVKFHRTPEANATGLSRGRYARMQKVVPSDHVDAVRVHADRRASALTLKRPGRAVAMKHTASTASDRVAARGAASKPLSVAESRALVKDPSTLRGVATRLELGAAVQSGAVSGAVVGGVLSVVGSVVDVARGDATVGDAALRTVKATAQSAATGAATAVIATAATRTLAQVGLRTVARSSAPLAIASTALELAGGAVNLARGRETAAEFGVKSAKAVARGGGTWAAAELGAFAGTAICPGVGTVIGGVVGGLLGGFGLSKLF